MTLETRDYVIEKVKAIMAAPSCCSELKEICMEWIQAAGSSAEDAATRSLLHELEDDVCTIDDVMDFFDSPAAAIALGEEDAKALPAQAREHTAKGGTHCFCPACTAGKAILDIRDKLL